MEAAYQTLATALMSACGSNFEEARVLGALQDDHSSISYECKMSGRVETVSPGLRIGADVDDALHELRTTMKQVGQEPWSKCTFTLFPDGKFKFDVEYDE